MEGGGNNRRRGARRRAGAVKKCEVRRRAGAAKECERSGGGQGQQESSSLLPHHSLLLISCPPPVPFPPHTPLSPHLLVLQLPSSGALCVEHTQQALQHCRVLGNADDVGVRHLLDLRTGERDRGRGRKVIHQGQTTLFCGYCNASPADRGEGKGGREKSDIAETDSTILWLLQRFTCGQGEGKEELVNVSRDWTVQSLDRYAMIERPCSYTVSGVVRTRCL